MPQWTRIFVLLTGIIAWIAMVAVSLWLKQIPSAVLIGFPAGLWIALRGASSISRERAETTRPADDVAATETEGDRA